MKRWHKVSIGIAVAILIAAGLGMLALSRLKQFLYPPAPPMPAATSESMPAILTRVEAILKTNAPHVLGSLQPGLSQEEISRLENQLGAQLPADIRAIYQWHNGSRRMTNYLSGDFIPIHRFLPLEEALAERTMVSPAKAAPLQRIFYRVFAGHRDSWICLFSDGAGDGYWFDLKRKADEGAVFYNFTEAATFRFFPSANNLMAGIAECYAQRAFFVKEGSSPPELDEDFAKAEKIWDKFGASNITSAQ